MSLVKPTSTLIPSIRQSLASKYSRHLYNLTTEQCAKACLEVEASTTVVGTNINFHVCLKYPSEQAVIPPLDFLS